MLVDGTLSFFKALKVVSDIFQPIIPPECFGVYSILARRDNFTSNPNNSVRELAIAANVSKATASRAIEILVHVGLVKRVRNGGSQPDCYELPNAWEAAKKWGALYISRSVSFSLSAENAQLLKDSVKALQAKHRGIKSASNTDVSVSPVRRQRSNGRRQRTARETQMGTHLLPEERRREENTCLRPNCRDCTAQRPKDSPDENEPERLLKWARDKFTGPMNDLGDHLFDISRPPNPRFANGAEEWRKFGFDSLAVAAAQWHDEVLALTLSASEPEAARRGLDKYRKTWEVSLRYWYECEVLTELVEAQR